MVEKNARPQSADPMARVAQRTNPLVLRTYVRVIGELPYRTGLFTRHHPANQGLGDWIEASFGVRALKYLVGVG